MLQTARRGLAISTVVHVVVFAFGPRLIEQDRPHDSPDLIDIEVAPEAPKVEALPETVAQRTQQRAQTSAQTTPEDNPPEQREDGFAAVDAGVDARPPIDAAIDAAMDAPIDAAKKPKPDAAPPDAAERMAADDAGGDDAGVDDAGTDDAMTVAVAEDANAGAGGGSGSAAAPGTESGASGSGAGSGSGSGTGAGSDVIAMNPGAPPTTTEPAVAGAPTRPGTAANLNDYFPDAPFVTAMIRFDRLRPTEWGKRTERLLRPMPDYEILFGTSDAQIVDKLDTVVISTPTPHDAVATTLVAHTKLPRPRLRTFLEAVGKVTWSPAKGGMLGTRSGSQLYKGDTRLFLSPFHGWFLLVHPGDIVNLATRVPGDVDKAVATVPLPPWIDRIRLIEKESGEDKGPALIVTLNLGGTRMVLGAQDFGLGISSFPLPERLTVAAELDPKGWITTGNMTFKTEKDAIEFVTAATTVQQRIHDSTMHRLLLGPAAVNVLGRLSFARTAARVSYATSASVADMRAIMDVAGEQLDQYFAAKRRQPQPPPPGRAPDKPGRIAPKP